MKIFEKKPSKECRFFLYDPEGEGMMYFRTKEMRDTWAETRLGDYSDADDGWNDEVEFMSRGEVIEFPQVLNKKCRPPAHEIDEHQCDREGIGWPDGVEWYGNYTWEK
jgi:hypothetical protein